MTKRLFSMALALALLLALAPMAVAAGTTETLYSHDSSTFTFTNVISVEQGDYVGEGDDEKMVIEENDVFYVDEGNMRSYLDEDFGWQLESGPPLIVHVDQSTVITFNGRSAEDILVAAETECYNAIIWDVEFEIITGSWNDEEYSYNEVLSGSKVTLTKPGVYLLCALTGASYQMFMVFVDGDAPAPAPTTPAVTPAPAVTTPGSTAKIKTTDGLCAVVPPAPIVETKDVAHAVAKGENLNTIAKKYGVTADNIKTWNKAYFDNLAARNKANKTNVALEANVKLVVKTMEVKPLAYTVQKGESLYGIAFNYYGTMSAAKVNEIKAANKAYFDGLAVKNKKNKTNVTLEAGAVLVLPANGLMAPVTQSSVSKAAGMYLVKSGDTLGQIAKLYYGDASQWKKILEANKDKVAVVNGSPMIYTGQWLVIPE